MRLTPRAILLSTLLVSAARAETWEYTIAVPDGMPATFELPFVVEHAGDVVLQADWSGTRLLSFRIDAPGHPGFARRSGPTPQRFELKALDPALLRRPGWKLTVKALPARGEAGGRVRITVPDAPEVVARLEAELNPPPPPPPPPPAWTLPSKPSAGAGADVVRVFEAVEAYRASVLAKDARPDDCKWQTDFLIYATTVRDRLAAGGPAPDVAALRYFERVAAAIGEVERMRTSKDPAIAGPRPAGSNERRIWMMERNEKIRPLERSLDELGELLRGGHAPSLKSAAWLPRLNACLMACERYFDEKVRADEPPSGELAAAEWPRILAAAAVLRSFSGYIPAP